MGLVRSLPIFALLSACVSEPSYEGRSCSDPAPCPGNLTCFEGRCRLLVPGESGDSGVTADAGEPADAGADPDAGVDPGRDAGADAGLGRDAEPKPDARPADAGMIPDGGVPDSGALCSPGETRLCYSGPEDTAGVGICARGLMTCDGTDFGPCEGEVLPGVEVCNGLDDDCDRTVDDGCPGGAVGFAQPSDTALTGWLPFGDTWASQGCGPGQVVVGFFGYYEEFLNQIGEHCSTPTIVEDRTSTPYRYSLVLAAAASANPRGGVMGTMFSVGCPPSTMVVGISGRSGNWIDRFSFSCAAFELLETPNPGATPSFTIREVSGTRTQVGLEAGGTGGAAFDLPCPQHRAATTRLRGATGSTTCCPSLVTTLGLGCGQLAPALR